jgi:hypothetical protein
VSRYVAADSPFWDAALDKYLEDEVEEALALVRRRGIGVGGEYGRWFRVFDAEATTRSRSRMRDIEQGLVLEYVPGEALYVLEKLVQCVADGCKAVATRFGADLSAPTLVSVLAEETDGPWAVSPYGYCIEKDPYYKICLPAYLLDDLDEAQMAVAHEYAHVICLELADGQTPRWLEEAISMLVEHGEDLEEAPKAWLSPADLESLLQTPSDDELLEDRMWDAYQQCGLIGRHLYQLGGDESIAKLLTRHTDEGMMRNLKLALFGKTRVDEAVRETYGISVAELFEQSRPAPSPVS